MEALDTEVAIETPEHIVFHTRVAGPARRALAQLLDLVICYTTIAALGALVYLAAGTGAEVGTSIGKAGIGLVLLTLFAAQWVYFVVCEGRWGTSPGKRVLGLVVVTTSGRPIGWRAAALRNLLRAADLLPIAYVVGVVTMALSSRFQRIGDLVAGTMVVVPERARATHALALAPPAEPREIATLPDVVALDVEERVAIELFLRRRLSLGVLREKELAEMIAGRIGERLGFTHPDPSRLLALVYDRAVNAGRTEAPPSSLYPPRSP